MAAEQQAVRAQQPIKISAQHTVALEATAGSSLESAASSGQVRLTNTPKLGEAEAFFPANPAIVGELAQNKPVKELAASDRTASGGLLRTISDVITELRQKHQDRKRVSVMQHLLESGWSTALYSGRLMHGLYAPEFYTEL